MTQVAWKSNRPRGQERIIARVSVPWLAKCYTGRAVAPRRSILATNRYLPCRLQWSWKSISKRVRDAFSPGRVCR